MSLELALSGEAVNPIITCSNEGHVNFDYVPVNESASQVFRVCRCALMSHSKH